MPAPRRQNGDVEVRILGLALGLRELPLDDLVGAPSLRWIGADGEPLPSYDALAARVAQLEAEVARLRDAK